MSAFQGVQTVARPEHQAKATLPPQRKALWRWLGEDWPYITMILLALVGVVMRLPVGYWSLLTPIFGIICVIGGWRHFETLQGRLRLLYSQALIWLALIGALFIMYSSGSAQNAILTFSATTAQMITLLALGTFVAGVQSRVWRICAVGLILFVAASAVGWLERSMYC